MPKWFDLDKRNGNEMKPTQTGTIVLAAVIFALVGCQSKPSTAVEGKNQMSIRLTSEAFQENQLIPEKYSCDGENISPPIAWSGVPDETRSLTLIVDDPDAPSGSFVHWVVYNIDPGKAGFPEAVPISTSQDLGIQGKNSTGKSSYSGPCPPKGSSHRYFFQLYALDTMLDVSANPSRAIVENAMKNHILATGQLVGIYSR
jgi:Raf kinase inhibitor-like YbhB/YbcL family protein